MNKVRRPGDSRCLAVVLAIMLLTSVPALLPSSMFQAALAIPIDQAYTIEGIVVYYNPSTKTVEYSFRGHNYADMSDWKWWSISANGSVDTVDPTKSISTWTDDVPEESGAFFVSTSMMYGPRPDVTFTRGGLGMAVWEDQQVAGVTCDPEFDPQTIPRGRIFFSHLDARSSPEQAPQWSTPAVLASGEDFTFFIHPSVALDVYGKGLAIWTEVRYSLIDGCINWGNENVRTLYSYWDGSIWSPFGVIPNTSRPAAGLFDSSYPSDIVFTSVAVDDKKTRQRAIAAWQDATIDSQTCPPSEPGGTPYDVSEIDTWVKYTEWDGDSFSSAADVPGGRLDANGPPFFRQDRDISKVGIAADRSGKVMLTFDSERVDDLCDTVFGGEEQVWAYPWNDVSGDRGWKTGTNIGSGKTPDISVQTGDIATTVFASSQQLFARTQSSSQEWTGSSQSLASITNRQSNTVASLPHGRTISAWVDNFPGGALKWSEKPSSGDWSGAAVLTDSAAYVEMAERPTARWLFMVYGAGDNNLEGALLKDLDEDMEQVGSNPDISVVVQADDKSNAIGIDGSFRAQIIHHPAAGLASAQMPNVIDVDEPNMAAATTLGDFLVWAQEEYPADKRALVIWDHGFGWAGVAQDKNDWISMSELKQGMSSSPNKLDVLGFDACLMAELEVANQVYDTAGIMVASQDCISAASGVFGDGGYPYSLILQGLEDNPSWTAEQFADEMVDRYATFYSGLNNGDEDNYTLSAIRLNNNFLDLISAVSQFALDLIDAAQDYNGHNDSNDNGQMAVRSARMNSHQPTIACGKNDGNCDVDSYVDLLDFTRKMGSEPNIDSTYKDSISTIQSKLSLVIINEAHGPEHDISSTLAGANGLSIYFPRGQSAYIKDKVNIPFDFGSLTNTLYAASPDLSDPLNHPYPAEPNFDFVANNNWDEFLYRYYNPVADAGNPVSGEIGNYVLLDGLGSSDSDGADLLPAGNDFDVDGVNNEADNCPWTSNPLQEDVNNDGIGDICNKYFWDFDPTFDSDDADTDKDGIDEANDDIDASGPSAAYLCVTQGLFPVKLVLRDNHEELALHTNHYNSDDDDTLVQCKIGSGTSSTSLSWEVRDDSGNLLNGATFEVSPDPFGSQPSLSGIQDCTELPCTDFDMDPDDGQFMLEDVDFGKYTITQTGVKIGFLIDSDSTRTETVSSADFNAVVGSDLEIPPGTDDSTSVAFDPDVDDNSGIGEPDEIDFHNAIDENSGEFTVIHKGTAKLSKAMGGHAKGEHTVSVEISGSYDILSKMTNVKIHEDSLDGTLAIGDHEYPLDVTKFAVSKTLKSITYSAELDNDEIADIGNVSGTIKFAKAIDFENKVDQSSLPAGKNTLKAKVANTNFDTKKTSIGRIIIGAEENGTPTADAGIDKTVYAGSIVTLDGTNSSDENDDPLTYSWKQTAGPEVELSDETSALPTFTAPDVDEETTLTFQLVVTDGIDDSEVDTVDIMVKPVVAGSFNMLHEGTAALTKAKGDFEAGDYAVEVALDGSYEIDFNGKLVVDADSLTGSISIGDHTHDLDITKFMVSKDKKTMSYSAKMIGVSGMVSGTIKFNPAIDFEGAVDASSAAGKSTLKATMEKVSFDTKKTSLGSIEFD